MKDTNKIYIKYEIKDMKTRVTVTPKTQWK